MVGVAIILFSSPAAFAYALHVHRSRVSRKLSTAALFLATPAIGLACIGVGGLLLTMLF